MDQSFDLSNFITHLASGEPIPGGGSAAAIAGALGAALVAMVGRLTAGRPRYAEVEGDMLAAVEEADKLRAELIMLAGEDALAYGQVMAAYRMPKDSEANQTVRNDAIQDALKDACETPLSTAVACLETLHSAAIVARLGNPNARTDGVVGALLLYAGLKGAILNVDVNLASVTDTAFVITTREKLQHIREEGAGLMAAIEDLVN